MLHFVQRDASGKVKGLYTVRQPQPDGSDLTDPTPLDDTHPDVVAFLNPPPAPPSALAQALDVAIAAVPSIDLRIRTVFLEWRKRV